MTETPLGFDGTINEPRWAEAIPDFAGADYGVISGWDLHPVAGADRTVKLTAGRGFGWGVRHKSPEVVLDPLPIVASPTWFVIGWDFSWADVGGTITAGFRQATSANIPPLTQTPGSSAFLPLWLVQVTPGEQMITGKIDKRVYPSQVVAVPSLDAIPVSNRRLGMLALLNTSNTLHRWTGSAWDALVDPAPRWTSYYRAPDAGGNITSQQILPPDGWIFPTWQGATSQTLAISVSTPRRLYFPSPGVYTVSTKIPISGSGFVGETALFAGASFNSPGVYSPWGAPTDVTPCAMFLRNEGTFTVPVLNKSVSYMVAYHNTSSGNQTLWVSGNHLTIVKVADL